MKSKTLEQYSMPEYLKSEKGKEIKTLGRFKHIFPKPLPFSDM